MHVIVVGCGHVGSGLAQLLDERGHSVAVVDRDPRAHRRLGESFSGQWIEGVGFDRDRLVEAGVEQAGAVAAVTNGDNSNILVARVCRETFGVDKVVARIYDQRRAAIYERLGIPTIAAVAWTIDRVLSRLLPDEADAVWTDPSANVVLVERPLPPAWAGRRLADLELDGLAKVVALTRTGVAHIPAPDELVQDGDVVHASMGKSDLGTFEARLAGVDA